MFAKILVRSSLADQIHSADCIPNDRDHIKQNEGKFI